jgi:quercetin dioxygenase-like cupin family protein
VNAPTSGAWNWRLASIVLAVIPMVAVIETTSATATAPHEVVHPQFQRPIPNLPGKSLTSVIVDYAPGAKSPAHRHAASAFVYAYVLTGSIRSQVGDEAPRVYRAGQDFYEAPGAHHRISENASTTEPARLLAVFVADTGQPLTIPDNH